MKKTSTYIALLAGALGLLALAQTTMAAPAGCCGGGTCPMMAKTADAAKPKPDLLTTCPVSKEKLGEMGTAYTFTYKDQEVKLCCKDCKKDFDKNPAKYMALIRAADKK